MSDEPQGTTESPAQKNLLREIHDLAKAMTQTTWPADFSFHLYALAVGDTDRFAGRALPSPILSHIDALPTLAERACGWFASPEKFLDLDEWEAAYESWRKEVRT